MSALSIISARPELISNMLVTKEANAEGLYVFRFFRGGEWMEVMVDDFLPCLPLIGFPEFDLQNFKAAFPTKPGTIST